MINIPRAKAAENAAEVTMMKTSGILTVSMKERGMSGTMPKIFEVKFKNTDLYSFVDDAVLEDALQNMFPRAVLEVNEIKEVNDMMKERMKSNEIKNKNNVQHMR